MPSRGSHATLAGWEPKTCHLCGQRVVVSRESLWFHYNHATKQGYSIHDDCGRHNPPELRAIIAP